MSSNDNDSGLPAYNISQWPSLTLDRDGPDVEVNDPPMVAATITFKIEVFPGADLRAVSAVLPRALREMADALEARGG